MKLMADAPEIIIRTAEERRAEEGFPWALAETRFDSGKVRLFRFDDPLPGDEHSELKTWHFKTAESRLVFAAARILEMRRDGVADIAAPYTQIYEECPDRRLSPDSYENPKRQQVRIPRSVPLEW